MVLSFPRTGKKTVMNFQLLRLEFISLIVQDQIAGNNSLRIFPAGHAGGYNGMSFPAVSRTRPVLSPVRGYEFKWTTPRQCSFARSVRDFGSWGLQPRKHLMLKLQQLCSNQPTSLKKSLVLPMEKISKSNIAAHRLPTKPATVTAACSFTPYGDTTGAAGAAGRRCIQSLCGLGNAIL